MLVKPTHTRILLQQIEKLLAGHEEKLKIWSAPSPTLAKQAATPTRTIRAKTAGKRAAPKAKKSASRRAGTTRAAKTAKG
jgi:hypothetical protein